MQAAKIAGKSSVEIDGDTFLCREVRPHFLGATFNLAHKGAPVMPNSSAIRKI